MLHPHPVRVLWRVVCVYDVFRCSDVIITHRKVVCLYFSEDSHYFYLFFLHALHKKHKDRICGLRAKENKDEKISDYLCLIVRYLVLQHLLLMCEHIIAHSPPAVHRFWEYFKYFYSSLYSVDFLPAGKTLCTAHFSLSSSGRSNKYMQS